jgi:hypothetical protein
VAALRERLTDVAASAARAALALPRGALRTAGRAADGLLAALVLARRGRPGRAVPVLVVAVVRLLVQLPADAVLILLARLVSGMQTLLGLEPPGRRLNGEELALLRRVYRDGIDPRPVRVKSGRLGLLGVARRAFVVGDTVHVPLPSPRAVVGREQAPPAADGAPSPRLDPALLVHELAHVWQHQRHGTRYLSECLLAQWLGEGYNIAAGLARGRSFAELNFEQQAELLERSWAAGWFAAEDAGGTARLLVRLLDPQRDDGFAVRLAAGEDLPAVASDGWLDATAVLVEGLAQVRAPRARPPSR